MRRLFLLGVLFVFFVSIFTVNSQILLDENFDYTAGDSLTAHSWVRHSGTQGQILVATPGLTFAGYPLSNIGNSAKLDTVGSSGIDVNKQLSSPDSISSVYVSFMVNVSYATATSEYFFHIGNSTLGTTFRGKVFAKDTLGGLRFGISKLSNTGTYSATSYNYNTTYLIVVKYKFNTGSTIDDEVSMYVINGAIPNTEPVTPTIGPLTDATANGDLGNVGTVALRQGVNTARPILLIDGIRVFKSWTNIVGIRPISTIAEKFTLSQNYPNPFNPETNIRFSIPERGDVSLQVFDMLGREVSNLVDGNFALGTYEVNFDAKGFGSGTYIYRMSFESETGKNFVDTKKMILVK